MFSVAWLDFPKKESNGPSSAQTKSYITQYKNVILQAWNKKKCSSVFVVNQFIDFPVAAWPEFISKFISNNMQHPQLFTNSKFLSACCHNFSECTGNQDFKSGISLHIMEK